MHSYVAVGNVNVLLIEHSYIWKILMFLTSRDTKGAKIPPILAATDDKPMPLLRASVGNSSLVYTYNRAKDVDTANLPNSEKNIMVPTIGVSVTGKKK